MNDFLKIITTLFILTSVLNINAQQVQEEGCISGDCENGQGKLVKKNVKVFVTYVGVFKNGNKNGHGTQTGLYNNGVKIVYDGLWKDDEKNGKGTEITNLTNGSVIKYIGEWKNHKKNGKGTRTINNTENKTKTDYNGEWVNDEYSGQGTHIITTDDGVVYKYSGQWSDNNKNGQGTLTVTSGKGILTTKYKGMWKNSDFHGQGELYKDGVLDFKGEFKDGNKYKEFVEVSKSEMTEDSEEIEGCISGDCKDGYGVYHYKYGNKYEGNWKNGKQNGKGTFINPDNSKITGNWTDNFQNGVFEVFDANGVLSHREVWGGRGVGLIETGCVGDCENGNGKYVWEDGNLYEGGWKNGLQHGPGNLYWFNGNKYYGNWEENLMSGDGTLIWNTGSFYIGQFKNGNMNGKGKFYDKDQVLIRTGTWIDDEYQVGETGCISGNCENGTGTYLWEDGNKYVGEWKNNEMNGTGTLYLENGEIYHKGLWKDHQKVN